MLEFLLQMAVYAIMVCVIGIILFIFVAGMTDGFKGGS